MVRPIEGDLIRLGDGSFFVVKGLEHPPSKVVAYPRYAPNERGDRKLGEVAYRKVYHWDEVEELLKSRYARYFVYEPFFDERICEIPISEVEELLLPEERLKELATSSELDSLEELALELAEEIRKESNISASHIGVSGSILAKLHGNDSDIDIVIYGEVDCMRAYESLLKLREEGTLRPMSEDKLLSLYEFRSRDTPSDLSTFLEVERAKVLQGEFGGREYSIKLLKVDRRGVEKLKIARYRKVGHAIIRARVADDSSSIFVPCVYEVERVEVLEGPRIEGLKEVASLRGRFCEVARVGDEILARGKVEEVEKGRSSYFRLLVGGSKGDFMLKA